MARKLDYIGCPTGKRSYVDEREAERALGRARARRQRYGDARGTRRGLKLENRTYWCDECEGHHVTEMSRRDFNVVAERWAA